MDSAELQEDSGDEREQSAEMEPQEDAEIVRLLKATDTETPE